MERREFVAAAGAALMMGRTVGRSDRLTGRGGDSPTVRLSDRQTPLLGPDVFARRQERLRQELITRKLDLFIAAPSTNFQYFAGYNPGRSERLIAVFVPAKGGSVIVCPSFEVERLTRNAAVQDIRGWEEQEDPWRLVRTALGEMKPQHGRAELALQRLAPRGPRRAEARAGDGRADRRRLAGGGVRLRHHPHHLVGRRTVGGVQESL